MEKNRYKADHNKSQPMTSSKVEKKFKKNKIFSRQLFTADFAHTHALNDDDANNWVVCFCTNTLYLPLLLMLLIIIIIIIVQSAETTTVIRPNDAEQGEIKYTLNKKKEKEYASFGSFFPFFEIYV